MDMKIIKKQKKQTTIPDTCLIIIKLMNVEKHEANQKTKHMTKFRTIIIIVITRYVHI